MPKLPPTLRKMLKMAEPLPASFGGKRRLRAMKQP
jgi:hypothetical protein